jgi:hypothetical protein
MSEPVSEAAAETLSESLAKPCTAFLGHRLLRAGPLVEVALAVKAAVEAAGDAAGADPSAAAVLVFDDATGRVVDLDLRGDRAEIVARLARPQPERRGRFRSGPAADAAATAAGDDAAAARGRGRPKLGVVAREVTLLPRQWEWLAAQPGGASAVLRRLVDEARRHDGARRRRAAQTVAYQVMQALAGDLAGYEEATRALFADDRAGFEARTAAWPGDVRAYALRLAFGTDAAPVEPSP